MTPRNGRLREEGAHDSTARPAGRERRIWRSCHPAGPSALTLQTPPPWRQVMRQWGPATLRLN